MAFSYSGIQRYEVTSKDGKQFAGHVFPSLEKDRRHELWIYDDIAIELNPQALNAQRYAEEVQTERPFETWIHPVRHVATVVDAASVVPVGAPLSLTDLQQRNKRK